MVLGLTPSVYVKAGSAIFGVYGIQMLLVPSNMMTDHFEAPATKYTDFWIRGQAATLGSLIYCLQNMKAELAAKAMLGLSLGIAILYPFNAKFGYLSKLEVKCTSAPCKRCPSLRCAPLLQRDILTPVCTSHRPDALRSRGADGGHDHRWRSGAQMILGRGGIQ